MPTAVQPPSTFLERLLSFHSDRRAQILPLIMFVGIAFCVGTGLVMNTGRVVNRRIEAQNAVDAAAVSGASCVARGMNFIARNNVTMAKILVTIVIVRSFRPAILASRIVLLIMQGVAIGLQLLAKILEGIPFLEGVGAALDAIATAMKTKIKQEQKVLKFLNTWMVKKIAKRWDGEILFGRLAGSGKGYGWKFLKGLGVFGEVLAYATPVYAQLTTKAVFGANSPAGGITDRDAWLFPLYPSLPICKGPWSSWGPKVQYGTPKSTSVTDLTMGVEPIAFWIGVAAVLPLTLSGFWITYPLTAHLELEHLFGAGDWDLNFPDIDFNIDLCHEDDESDQGGDGGDEVPKPSDAPPLNIPYAEQQRLKRQVDAITTYPGDQAAWDASTNPYQYKYPSAWLLESPITSAPPAKPNYLAGGSALNVISTEAKNEKTAAASNAPTVDPIIADIGLQDGSGPDGISMYGNFKSQKRLNQTAAEAVDAPLEPLLKTKPPGTSSADKIREADRHVKLDTEIIDKKQRLLYGDFPATFDADGKPIKNLDPDGKPIPPGQYNGSAISTDNHAPPNGIMQDMKYASTLISLQTAERDAKIAASKSADPNQDADVVKLNQSIARLKNRRDYLDGQRYELEADIKTWSDDRDAWQKKEDAATKEGSSPDNPPEPPKEDPDPVSAKARPRLTRKYHPFLLEGPDAWPRSFTYFALAYRDVRGGTFMGGSIKAPKGVALYGDPKIPGFRDGDVMAAIPVLKEIGNYAFSYAAARVYNNIEDSVDMWTANWSAKLVRVEFKNLPRNPLGHLPGFCPGPPPEPEPKPGEEPPPEPPPEAEPATCNGSPDAAGDGEEADKSSFLSDCFGIDLPSLQELLAPLKELLMSLIPDWHFQMDWSLTLPLAPGALNKH